MAKGKEMTLQGWINEINRFNSSISQWGQSFPHTNLSKMERNQWKDLVYRNVRVRLTNIILKMFKWTVPDQFNPRVIEMGYLTRGAVCAYKGPIGEYCLPCIANNKYNVYGDPTTVRVFGFNGYEQEVAIKYGTEILIPNQIEIIPSEYEGVFSRDNDMLYPYVNYVDEYSYKIADKLVALHIATQKLKSPFMFVVDSKELVDTVQDITDKIENNEDLIVRVKSNGLQDSKKEIGIRTEDIGINPENIRVIKESILFDFNMFLETIGINTNPSPDKAQVVLTPELNSNNNLIDLEQDVRYLNRQKFCEDVKAILGIDMSVELNVNELEKEIDNFKGGLEDNGSMDVTSRDDDRE